MNNAEFFRTIADMMERGEDPCDNIEYMFSADKWVCPCTVSFLVRAVCDADYSWRIRPRMIRVGDVEWPEPMKVAPTVGTPYWVVDLASCVSYGAVQWEGDHYDLRNLERNLCHLTEEAAEAHSQALIKLSGKVAES